MTEENDTFTVISSLFHRTVLQQEHPQVEAEHPQVEAGPSSSTGLYAQPLRELSLELQDYSDYQACISLEKDLDKPSFFCHDLRGHRFEIYPMPKAQIGHLKALLYAHRPDRLDADSALYIIVHGRQPPLSDNLLTLVLQPDIEYVHLIF